MLPWLLLGRMQISLIERITICDRGIASKPRDQHTLAHRATASVFGTLEQSGMGHRNEAFEEQIPSPPPCQREGGSTATSRALRLTRSPQRALHTPTQTRCRSATPQCVIAEVHGAPCQRRTNFDLVSFMWPYGVPCGMSEPQCYAEARSDAALITGQAKEHQQLASRDAGMFDHVTVPRCFAALDH